MDKLSRFQFVAPEAEQGRYELPADVRKALSALALAVNHALEEEQLKVTAYALKDLSVPLLRRACLELAGTARFWPRPAEIREAAERLAFEAAEREAAAKLLPAPVGEDDERKYFCLDCRDEPAAWRSLWCPGIGKAASAAGPKERLSICGCARRQPHASHSYVEHCACWDVNPNIAEHRRRIASFQQKRQEHRS